MVNLTDLFKTKDSPPANTPKVPQRDAHGHFISTKPKKESTPTPAPAKTEVKPQTPPSTSISTPQLADTPPLTFYGHVIHYQLTDNQRLFNLTDLISTANIVDPESYTEKLLKDKDFDKTQITTVDNDKYISCDTFLVALPTLRSMGLSFLGPLPEWLKDTSQIQ